MQTVRLILKSIISQSDKPSFLASVYQLAITFVQYDTSSGKSVASEFKSQPFGSIDYHEFGESDAFELQCINNFSNSVIRINLICVNTDKYLSSTIILHNDYRFGACMSLELIGAKSVQLLNVEIINSNTNTIQLINTKDVSKVFSDPESIVELCKSLEQLGNHNNFNGKDEATENNTDQLKKKANLLNRLLSFVIEPKNDKLTIQSATINAVNLALKSKQCGICCNDYDDNMFVLMCNHVYCKVCIVRTIDVSTSENKLPKCPSCNYHLNYDELTMLYDNDNYIDRLISIVLNHVTLVIKVICCPNVECNRILRVDESGGKRANGSATLTCYNCSNHFCLECKKAAHSGRYCNLTKENDELLTTINNLNCKYCPHCKSIIEKNDGCNHMTCGKCRYEFCWLCLDNWNGHTACKQQVQVDFKKLVDPNDPDNLKIPKIPSSSDSSRISLIPSITTNTNNRCGNGRHPNDQVATRNTNSSNCCTLCNVTCRYGGDNHNGNNTNYNNYNSCISPCRRKHCDDQWKSKSCYDPWKRRRCGDH